MKTVERIAAALWYLLVAIVFFVMPLYLLAIYPESPPLPHWRAGANFRDLALQNFWYRLAFCGGAMALGLLILLLQRRVHLLGHARTGEGKSAMPHNMSVNTDPLQRRCAPLARSGYFRR